MKKVIRVVVLGTSVTCALVFGGVNVAQAQQWPGLPGDFFSDLTTLGPGQHNRCDSRLSLGTPEDGGTGGVGASALQPGSADGPGSTCRNTRG
ncbi:hypothetical protein VT50_0209700 [Streptomyces antioxidans]|uniref:Secreted protein n=1 Tax=Streptomyces antioxidans TaxID=1507734 RepID=A0A1V4D887_9ACTN|nr:hypothetical protein [Streptomyces antioxidans]OPF81342.1 hypothetical protein VT50_0209700 [Streptomyces antioxidans]